MYLLVSIYIAAKLILFWFSILLVASRKHLYFLAYSTEVDQKEPQALQGQTRKLEWLCETPLKGLRTPPKPLRLWTPADVMLLILGEVETSKY